MADIRTSVGSSALVPQGRPLPAARSEAIRAAQKAFFEAALMGSSTAPATPAAAAVSAVQPTRLETREVPSRSLRPGSLVDIKV